MPLVLGLMCPYRLLLLALVLSISSYVSHSGGDVNVMFFKGLVEVIFLVESVRSVFWLLIV